MKWISSKLSQISLSILCFLFNSPVAVYPQELSYSMGAQEILDIYSADNLDVFKFSINNILNSQGTSVENSNGDPTIFGRTDYGSEFLLENELENTFSIEIPAFVINDLAENEMGDYFPVLKNGTCFSFTDTLSPVLGLRPTRASRFLTENAPKPRNSTRSPFAIAVVISSNTVFTIRSTSR